MMTTNTDTPRDSLRLTRADDGRIVAHTGGKEHRVRLRSCFPWSAPGAFVSMRDDENHEVAFVADGAQLDPDSRRVLEGGLEEVNFSFEITGIDVMRMEFEIRHWEVRCAQGRRSFQTRKDDWPKRFPPSGLLIEDVAGDIYTIQDWTALDRHSRKLLAMYID